MSSTSSANGHRQRQVDTNAAKSDPSHTATRQGNGDLGIRKGSSRDTEPWTFGRAVELAVAVLPFTAMVGLIFGGCCSNVREQ